MKKLLLALFIAGLTINQAFATDGWQKSEPAGTQSISDIDTYVLQNNAALDLMLAGYRQNVQIKYLSASTLTVAAGEIMVANSAGTIRLMLRNTAATTVSWSDIDTGSEATSTTYYVYAIASAVTDTTFTIKISASSSAPSSVTYYKRLGSFYNDSSGNITLINNDDDLSEIGAYSVKSLNTTYQATTDVIIVAYISAGSSTGDGELYGYTDGTSACSTIVTGDAVNYGGADASGHYNAVGGFSFPVKKGDYYKVNVVGDYGGAHVYAVTLQ